MVDGLILENQKNQKYIEENLDALKQFFLDKFLVVYHQEIVASFHTFQEASEFGVSKFGIKDAFLIYHLEEVKPVNFVVHAKSIDYSSSNHKMNLSIC
jgi:hypothetical protein